MPFLYQNLSEWLTHLESVRAQGTRKIFSSDRAKRFEHFKNITQTFNVRQWDCPIITVAGTNGKGSCVALLTAILKAAGYRVGAFTSPHLLRYNERIQINGEPVSDEQLCGVFEKIAQLKKEAVLGYFEYSTLAALLLFQKAHLDIIVLEVGVGGRFDPVNSLDSTVAIISSIDYDHMQLLGHSIEAIAFEKAGIVRAGQPAIWGDSQLPDNIKEYAQTLGAFLWVQEKDFGIRALQHKDRLWEWWNEDQILSKLPIPNITYLPNAACVLQAIAYLNTTHLVITKKAITIGLKNIQLAGRFQVIANYPNQIIVDVAHNPASARLLAQNLARFSYTGRLLAVVGMLAKKDIANILSPLVTQVSHWYLGSLPVSGAATPQALAQHLKPHAIHVFSTIENAYNAAVGAANQGDVIVIFGSFHAVEAVLKLNIATA